ncbi:MAG: alpha/beta fold hydrolase [Candidatus Lokiarchaeota archaeon]|nr:alpha/beta fold hydrolase [Candidatus Lokiarchaeota archaeon]MBD3201782.1 alpha/beta fold hydrolase [Candidatus Lokiarchaeota archaeon]
MPYITFQNKKIFYEIIDNSKDNSNENALIFIHGSGEHSFVWKKQLENLDLKVKLIAIDLLSHGKSDEYDELSLNLYVNCVKKLIDDLTLRKTILLGHSLGGAIIQQYFFDYPQDIAGLILCSTGAKLRVLPVILNNTLTNFEKFLENVPVGAFYRKTDENLKQSYVEEVSKITPEAVHSDFKICDNFDVMDEISNIDIPCLIIVGAADKLTPVKYSEYFHSHIENSEFVVIEKTGHSVMLEKPKEFNHAIKKYYNKHF